MSVWLLENSLKVDIFFAENESEYDDDICICIVEDCPQDERLFIADETNIFITPEQASLLVLALERAMENYRKSGQKP